MTDGRADRLTSGRVHPKGTNFVIITRACGEPLRLIEQINLHLITVQHRLALSKSSHTELFYIGLIELLCLLQQVINIHTKLLWHRSSIRVIAKAGLPEHEEVFTLLHSPPRPLGIAAEHIVGTFLESLIPRARAVILVEIFDFRLVHHLYIRRFGRLRSIGSIT